MKILKIIIVSGLGLISTSALSGGSKINDGYRDPAPTAINYSEIEARAMKSLNAVQGVMSKKASMTQTIRVIKHDPMVTVPVYVREYMDAVIALPSREKIVTISLGESVNFKAERWSPGIDNMIRIHAELPGADTTLTVLGQNQRIYSFYLRSIKTASNRPEDMVTYIIDDGAKSPLGPPPPVEAITHPTPGDLVTAVSELPIAKNKNPIPEYLMSKKGIDPTDLYFDFEQYGGSKSLMPQTIYSDGTWTYFQFAKDGESLSDMPIVYKVVDGYDHPVDSRVEKGTLIMKTTGKYWTIRKGEKHACVRKGA